MVLKTLSIDRLNSRFGLAFRVSDEGLSKSNDLVEVTFRKRSPVLALMHF